jgi:hypothetical protein
MIREGGTYNLRELSIDSSGICTIAFTIFNISPKEKENQAKISNLPSSRLHPNSWSSKGY